MGQRGSNHLSSGYQFARTSRIYGLTRLSRQTSDYSVQSQRLRQNKQGLFLKASLGGELSFCSLKIEAAKLAKSSRPSPPCCASDYKFFLNPAPHSAANLL